jgi:hypothetical protein
LIVNALDILGAVRRPSEAEAELIIDADRMLTLAITCERFQVVAGERSQIIERGRLIERAGSACGEEVNECL